MQIQLQLRTASASAFAYMVVAIKFSVSLYESLLTITDNLSCSKVGGYSQRLFYKFKIIIIKKYTS